MSPLKHKNGNGHYAVQINLLIAFYGNCCGRKNGDVKCEFGQLNTFGPVAVEAETVFNFCSHNNFKSNWLAQKLK